MMLNVYFLVYRLRLKDTKGQNYIISWLKSKFKRSSQTKEKQS
jgi:hypothetical protein